MKRGEMRKEKKERKAKVRNKTKESKMWRGRKEKEMQKVVLPILVRESLLSLYICRRSDRRILSRQEGKLFYKERTTCGLLFLGVSSNSKR